MNELIKMIISALGAAAVAVAILAGIGLALATASAVAGGVVAAAIVAAPTVLCLGGVAYAASRTGYGERG